MGTVAFACAFSRMAAIWRAVNWRRCRFGDRALFRWPARLLHDL
jgi:hypothetical protein